MANGIAFSAISLFFLLLSIFSCVTMKMVDIGLKVLDFQSPSGNKWIGESVIWQNLWLELLFECSDAQSVRNNIGRWFDQ